MKRNLFFSLFIFALAIHVGAQEKSEVVNLQCNFANHPLGIDSIPPILSWEISSKARNVMQKAFQVMIVNDPQGFQKNTAVIWDSKKVVSEKSLCTIFKGLQIKSDSKYFWKVKIWDNNGKESEWSNTSFWQTGLFSPKDWGNASWIGYEELPDSMIMHPGLFGYSPKLTSKWKKRNLIPLFRKEIEVKKDISSATLYMSGLGQFEAYINGLMLGNAFLQPGWTAFEKTVLYKTFDVTTNLKSGKNALGVIVGNGFFNVNRERYRKVVISYGAPRFICKLVIQYTDGSTDIVTSGKDWLTSPSPVTFSTMYGGEDYNAQLEQPGWNNSVFNASGWKNALLVKPPEGVLTADEGKDITIAQTIPVHTIRKLADSLYVYDFGQNASGIVGIKVQGKKGQRIKFIPAELLTPQGKANQKATGSPYYFSYTLKGDGIEEWKPRFSYYGFRYVQVEGAVPDTAILDGAPKILDLKLLHTRNSAASIGTFECSNELFNRIYTLINWAIKSNIQHVVTDCPHREKLGWMEQTYLMGEGIHYNFDIYHLYNSLIRNMKDAQTADGLIPTIAPEYILFDSKESVFRDSPEWGSASIILPWMVYKWYGDEKVLENSWPMVEKYIQFLEHKSKNYLVSYGLGDWYDMGPNPPGFAQLTPMGLTATATYYYDLQIVTQIARILKKNKTYTYYSEVSDSVRSAFNREFYNLHTHIYANGSQTAMAMPLCLGLVKEKDRKYVVKNMVDSIVAGNQKLTAGDIGFHFLVEALSKNGAGQLLFEMNNRDDVPGYGFQLKKGATALTESWPALETVSNNHLMLGHIMEWFYSGVGGISQAENSVAYRDLVIAPEIVGDIHYAKTSFVTPQGLVKTDWEKKDGTFRLEVQIPANSKATIYIPFTSEVNVSDINNEKLQTVKTLGIENGKQSFRVGSGSYVFRCAVVN